MVEATRKDDVSAAGSCGVPVKEAAGAREGNAGCWYIGGFAGGRLVFMMASR